MLKIIFDVKCGFEKLYLVEKGAEFNLDFLYTDQTAFNEKFPNKIFLTETELYNCYAGKPEGLISDYDLFKVLKALLASEYYAACFAGFKQEVKRFFPELFVIENCRLVLDQDEDHAVEYHDNSGTDDLFEDEPFDDDPRRYDA